MKIHEYQGKELFRRYGIAVPEGSVAATAAEAAEITRRLGGQSVVKAQIHAGGRGKGTLVDAPEVHGVKVCRSADAAAQHAQALLGQTLRTHQTGPEGRAVKHVLVEALSNIKEELYVALVVDREHSCVTFIASRSGGMDIEKVAAETPDKILHVRVDPAAGFSGYQARKLAFGLGLDGALVKEAVTLFGNLYRLFIETDASLVEVNPLVRTGDKLLALDAKINFDDNALFRHPEIATLRDVDEEDPQERHAKDVGLSYVALDGSIGCLVNGAGLAMSTMDIIKHVGGEPANFLDVGGGATEEQVTQAFTIILQDPKVKAILVNIFGGIAKCDVIANGIVAAARKMGLKVPLVVRLEGTHVELGKDILKKSGVAIIPADDMLDAAQKAVRAAQGGSL